MFSPYNPAPDRILLNFGSAAPATFAGFVKAEEVPEYRDSKEHRKPLLLTAEHRVEDDATALFRAFGLY